MSTRRAMPPINVPPMPRGLIRAGLAAEVNAAEVMGELVNIVDTRVGALEKEVDRLSARRAASIALGTGDGKAERKRKRRESMQALGAFARFKSAAQMELRDYLTANPQAAMTVGSNPDGGYTVLPEIEKAILTVSADVSPMRALATVVQVGSDSYEFFVDPSMAEVAWVGEQQARPQTLGPQFHKSRIEVAEMAAMPAASQSLLDDSVIDVGAYLADRLGSAFALKEAQGFTIGTGVLQPRGFLSYEATSDSDFNADGSRNRAWGKLEYFAVGASDPSDAQLADGFVNTAARLRSPYRANARWILSRQMYAQVRTLKDSYGRYLLTSGNGGIEEDAGPELLCGFPIGAGPGTSQFDENMPSTTGANAFVAALGDWRQGYVIVDRVGIRILRDPFTARPLVLFYSTKRVGGGVQNYDAIKLLKCSTS